MAPLVALPLDGRPDNGLQSLKEHNRHAYCQTVRYLLTHSNQAFRSWNYFPDNERLLLVFHSERMNGTNIRPLFYGIDNDLPLHPDDSSFSTRRLNAQQQLILVENILQQRRITDSFICTRTFRQLQLLRDFGTEDQKITLLLSEPSPGNFHFFNAPSFANALKDQDYASALSADPSLIFTTLKDLKLEVIDFNLLNYPDVVTSLIGDTITGYARYASVANFIKLMILTTKTLAQHFTRCELICELNDTPDAFFQACLDSVTQLILARTERVKAVHKLLESEDFTVIDLFEDSEDGSIIPTPLCCSIFMFPYGPDASLTLVKKILRLSTFTTFLAIMQPIGQD